jgi:hypothetical protein
MYTNESSSSSLSVMQSQQSPSRLGTALGAIIAFLFIIFGLVGDFLIIISILSKRDLRNNLVNIFIVSLQLNDIFNISFNQLMVGLGYVFMQRVGPHILCQIFVYTSIICSGSLLWHHALISIHRYLVVVCNQNNSYLGMSSKVYVLLSLIIARLIPILVCAPAIIAQNSTVYSNKSLRCMLAPNNRNHISILVVNIIVPCIIVIVCFAKIFSKVRQVSRNIRKTATNFNGYNLAEKRASLPNSLKGKEKQANNKPKEKNNSIGSLQTSTKENNKDISGEKSINSLTNSLSMNQTGGNQLIIPGSQPTATVATGGGGSSSGLGFATYSINSMYREIQITKMFAIIFTVFLFGYLPYGTIRLFDKNNNLNPDVYILLTVLFIISISVSPIIYGLMNTQIREQCKHLLRKLFNCDIVSKWDEELYTNRNIMPRMSRISSYQGAGITFDANRNNSTIELTRKNSTKLAALEFKAKKSNSLSISVPVLSDKEEKTSVMNVLNASMKRNPEMQKQIESLKQEQPLLDKKVAIYDEKNSLSTKRGNLKNVLIKECTSNENENENEANDKNEHVLKKPADDKRQFENTMVAFIPSNASKSCNNANEIKISPIKKSILDKFKSASASISIRSSTKSLSNKKEKPEKKSEHSLTNDETKAFFNTNKNFKNKNNNSRIQRNTTNSNSLSISTNSNSNSKRKPIDDGDDGGIYKGP